MVAISTTYQDANSLKRGTSMPLFARVFVTVLDSSIAEDFTLRHVFEDLFKLCDWKTGVVDMTRQAISRRLNIPLKTLNECLDKLEAPDAASRDPDHEGRRLKRLDEHRDWGWLILNWQKYDAIRNRADVALRVQRHREKKKDEVSVTVEGPPVSRTRGAPGNSGLEGNRPPSLEQVIEAGKMLSLPEAICRKFWLHYEGTATRGENGENVWMTGDKAQKVVGNWRSILGIWAANEREFLDKNKGGHRSPREHIREPGNSPAPLPVQTFSQPASKP